MRIRAAEARATEAHRVFSDPHDPHRLGEGAVKLPTGVVTLNVSRGIQSRNPIVPRGKVFKAVRHQILVQDIPFKDCGASADCLAVNGPAAQ